MRFFTCVVFAFHICASVLHAAEPQKSNDIRVEAITRSVTIYRDTYGVPHVYGPTDASVVFGFVYAQAEDNFLQIEENYIRALGRASEFYGQDIGEAYEKETSFGDDLLVKLFEMPRLSQAEYERASSHTRELCCAVADGLNYFLARNPQVKPKLIVHFEPWYVLALIRKFRREYIRKPDLVAPHRLWGSDNEHSMRLRLLRESYPADQVPEAGVGT
jgi:acyl-homoserine-lactone acylase